jgi:hypothetical protein
MLGGVPSAEPEKKVQNALLERFIRGTRPSSRGWALADDAVDHDTAKGSP